MADFADQLATLVESRLPLTLASDGSEDDWNLVGPALLAAAVRHLRTAAHLQATLPSAVIIWQLVRSMFEYAVTYAWVAADPAPRAQLWLKDDYQERIKLHNDLASFGETLLAPENLDRITARVDAINGALPGVPVLAEQADAAWDATLAELDAYLPEDFRRFRRLYPVIYRNGSRFTHPTTHVAARFISGDPPELSVGDERPLERDLKQIATGALALAVAVATAATPELALTLDDVHTALTA